MTGYTDLLLTLLLLAPGLVTGVAVVVLLWPKPCRRKYRRLTDAEVRAMYRITAERARQRQWN